MASVGGFSSVQVLYQLSWDGRLEHPHMIEVQYPSDQDGLCLRDVKKRLNTLRGHGISQSFSWSCKRNYRNTFIWKDLSDNDVIHPLRVSGEYLLKASELIDSFASKQAEQLGKYKSERKQSNSRTMSAGNVKDKDNLHSGARALGGNKLSAGSMSSSDREDESPRGVSTDISQKLPTLSVDQETIDVEKSDFCLSSSDNEISPRPKMADCTKPVKEALVVMTEAPVVQELQTPSNSSLTSPTEPPASPGSTKRMWKREIRKNLFRTSRSTTNENLVSADENATLQVEASPTESCTQEDASFFRHGRSKSISPSSIKEYKEVEKQKDVEQSTSLIRSFWSRWTGGSSKSKRVNHRTREASTIQDTKQMNPRSRTHSPCKERRPSPHAGRSYQSTRQSTTVESRSCDSVDKNEIALQEDHDPIPRSPRVAQITNPLTKSQMDGGIAVIKRTPIESPEPQELKKEKVVLSVEIPNLQVDMPDSPTSDSQGGPPEPEVDTPTPAVARAKTGNGLSRVKTTSPKPLPPGFHKGTNDTKPVQTPRRNLRTSIPLASPPLMRSLSRDAARGFSGPGAITASTEKDSVTSTPSPENALVKTCIDIRERDERPLLPGLTTINWEKALQEAAADCLPPANFREILQQCSTCGRTFKPDSLQVHKRGCHPPQYARAFSARASPHVVRSRAA